MPQFIIIPDSFPTTIPGLWNEIERISYDVCGRMYPDRDFRKFLSKAEIPHYRQGFYRQFSIPKKSGGIRHITAPAGPLKDAQKAISVLLTSLYNAPEVANGFIAGRSVKTNAEPHLGKNYVFNTDLKDFFPSITAKMISDALVYYGVRREIAKYISIVCTFMAENDDLPEDVLPQGSPASPVLSNIVCCRLDRTLDWLARKYGSIYSRYADDITFSSMHSLYGKNSPFLKEVRRILSEYGFAVNEEKTRLQKKGGRQEVTGIIVNEKTNVCRRYLKNLRAEVFRMEMCGFTKAQYRRVMGKIAFVGMVRGIDDSLYLKLLARVRSVKWCQQGFLTQIQ